MVVNFILSYYILFVLCCIIRNRIASDNDYHMLLSKESTGALKGAAIFAVVISHICQDAPELKNLLIGGKHTYTILFSGGGIGVAIFFLLSGYGCYISIEKTQKEFIWFLKHALKMLIYFAVTFALVLLFSNYVLKGAFGQKEWIQSFIALRFPGTTSWYFKIQILFYLLLALSEKAKKGQTYLILIFILVYSIIADYCGLPDYWWKTSLCFAVGCCIAKYRDSLSRLIHKNVSKLFLIVIGCGAYIYTIVDLHYILIPQLLSYACIAVCIVVMWDYLIGKCEVLERVGQFSLAIYLIHIGVVDLTFSSNFGLETRIVIFILTTIIGAVCVYWCSEYIYKFLLQKVKGGS